MVYANFFPLGDQVYGPTQYVLGNHSTSEPHLWPYHPHNFLAFGKQYFDRRKNHSSTVS